MNIIIRFSRSLDLSIAPFLGSREHVHASFKQHIFSHNITLDPTWQVFISADNTSPSEAHTYVWEMEGEEMYKSLMGTYLSKPSWMIRLARFKGTLEERTEEINVTYPGLQILDIWNKEFPEQMPSDNLPGSFYHSMPENAPGASLNEAETRNCAQWFMHEIYGDKSGNFKEIFIDLHQAPARRDWEFVFQDTSIPLKNTKALVSLQIKGDRLASYKQEIEIPSEWSRSNKAQASYSSLLSIISGLAYLILLGIVLLYAIIFRSRKNPSSPLLNKWTGALFLLLIFLEFNRLTGLIAHYSTIESFSAQFIVDFFSIISKGIIFVSILALLVFLGNNWRRDSQEVLRKNTIALACAVGAIAASIAIFSNHYAKSFFSPWPDFSYVDSVVPWFSVFANTIIYYAVLTTGYLIAVSLSDRWSRNWTRYKVLIATCMMLGGFLLSSKYGTTDLKVFAIRGALLGLFFIAAYNFVFRRHFVIIPIVTATIAIFETLIDYYYSAEDGVFPAVIAISLISYYWSKHLCKRSYAFV
ncbi:MAG: hypothetical protein A2Y62_02120 [Candidatus Fischerbacteria bacterium RBG_13_37_8]|uniref:Uncharacterized protein n=1 Tax=Candidatus Fischerbacteria bacterium RBG_13_37_8 TaxID=1817863 RepID=A0A1F5VJU2_9BACT|nr:MAG: hypothetical protein A2Y62_02120 [Candidatus Fischerbacteria bacterium RBG_13_37_8]